ncbi:MAG TPA: hypothetical protein VK461_10615, partial [Acidimicrobiales bacterium]|nr:hypothetical protein [Acidimicrobiales bacterium]
MLRSPERRTAALRRLGSLRAAIGAALRRLGSLRSTIGASLTRAPHCGAPTGLRHRVCKAAAMRIGILGGTGPAGTAL